MHYKLKQSTLENQAGDIFTVRNINGADCLVPPSGDATRALPLSTLGGGKLEQFFDAIEIDPDRNYQPEIGSDYYFTESAGTVGSATNGQTVDDAARIALDNVFQTADGAESRVNWLKARAAIKRDVNGQYTPDWSKGMIELLETNGEEGGEARQELGLVAWYVALDRNEDQLVAAPIYGYNDPQALAYYETEDDALAAISRLEAEYKTYFAGL